MRKNKFFAVLFLCLSMIVFANGCSLVKNILEDDSELEVTMTEALHGIYQINLDDTKLKKISYEIQAPTPQELIENCLIALQQTPSDNAYKCVISGNVKVLSYAYDASNRTVMLYFDEAYRTLTASREILTRAAIVKTLTQFTEEIQYVSFVIGERSLDEMDAHFRMMRGQDFVIDIGGSMEYVREDYVTMYFVNNDGTMLQTEDVIVKYSSTINLETAVVNSLISGPITDGLRPSLSSEVQVNKVNVKEGICYVDLNDAFLERVENQSFQLNIYSIVNTLTQMPGITRVQFLIDGEIFNGSIEGIRLDSLFEKNVELVNRVTSTETSEHTTEKNVDLTKDIEQQVIEEQQTIESSNESVHESVPSESINENMRETEITGE